jgi:hypothetical protein
MARLSENKAYSASTMIRLAWADIHTIFKLFENIKNIYEISYFPESVVRKHLF